MASKALKRVAATKRKRAAAELKKSREKRGRRLIIAGAILFVCTYSLKEVFRDELKGLSESLAAAQNSVEAGDAQQIMSARQVEANVQLRSLQEKMADPRKAATLASADLQADLADLSQLYSDLELNVARVSDLADRLPAWVRNRDKAKGEMKSALDKAHQAMSDTVAASKIPNPETKKRFRVQLGIIQVLGYAIQIAVWEDSITGKAKAIKTLTDILYELCTWGAFALTVVGVVLATKGKLHGDKDAEV